MKIKTVLIFLVLFVMISCNQEKVQNRNRIISKVITIEFFEPFTFSNKDTLTIDNLEFTHVFSIDSINNGNFLPKEKIIFFKVENKKATTKTNSIKIARILAKKLKATGKYKILNKVDILTKGIVKFKKIDNKSIVVTYTKKYLAEIKSSE